MGLIKLGCGTCGSGKFDFSHSMTSSSWMHVFGKTFRYSLEHATGGLHSKFGPILMNTDRVLCRNAGKG